MWEDELAFTSVTYRPIIIIEWSSKTCIYVWYVWYMTIRTYVHEIYFIMKGTDWFPTRYEKARKKAIFQRAHILITNTFSSMISRFHVIDLNLGISGELNLKNSFHLIYAKFSELSQWNCWLTCAIFRAVSLVLTDVPDKMRGSLVIVYYPISDVDHRV